MWLKPSVVSRLERVASQSVARRSMWTECSNGECSRTSTSADLTKKHIMTQRVKNVLLKWQDGVDSFQKILAFYHISFYNLYKFHKESWTYSSYIKKNSHSVLPKENI